MAARALCPVRAAPSSCRAPVPPRMWGVWGPEGLGPALQPVMSLVWERLGEGRRPWERFPAGPQPRFPR